MEAIELKNFDDVEGIIRNVLKSGNDVEIRTCKEGVKIVEVEKHPIAIIKK